MKGFNRRDHFTSIGVMMALAGSAVGLGNLWRFPYLVGQNGGAAFIVIYLLCVVILCMPMMFSEFIIGRRSQADAVTAFKKLAPGSKFHVVGSMGVIASFLIISFYSVVGGWGVKYFASACLHRLSSDTFDAFVSDAFQPILYLAIFLALNVFVVALGIKKGIEKFSKIMMPVLFVLIVIIAVRSITLPNASAGLEYLFKADFSKVTSKTVIAALGQSFFSLSLGVGTIITYASYASKDENILRCSTVAAISDTIFALIAGCAIIPAVFAYGLSPNEGPGLLFVTLPYIFSSMPFGGVAAILFFFALILAALTSSISLLEVVTSYVTQRFKVKRTVVVTSCFFAILLLGSLCSLSLGAVPQIRLFGKSLFDLFDYVTANILMTVGSILITVFVGWKLGKKAVVEELTNNGKIKVPKWILDLICFVIRYVAPLAILAIILFQ